MANIPFYFNEHCLSTCFCIFSEHQCQVNMIHIHIVTRLAAMNLNKHSHEMFSIIGLIISGLAC